MGYKFIKMLGKGSYGTVYLAKNESNLNIDEYVAIKKFFINDKNSYKSYKNELKILKKIKSKYLIKIFDYYRDSQYMYIVMEYAPEGDLEDYIRRKYNRGMKINNNFIDTVLYQINEGLSTLHKEKIIHRDIKTSNILVFNENLVKITDFGVSKILENNNLAYSNIGTPYYMSPEMLNGNPYNYMVDFWALGCVIYKMLTNKYPFEANNIGTLIYKIKSGRYDLSTIPFKYKKIVAKLINNKNERANNKEIDNFIISNCNTIVNFYELNCQNNLKSSPIKTSNLNKNILKPINNTNQVVENKLKPIEQKYKNLIPIKNRYQNVENKLKPIEQKYKNLIPIENKYQNVENKLKPAEQKYNKLMPIKNRYQIVEDKLKPVEQKYKKLMPIENRHQIVEDKLKPIEQKYLKNVNKIENKNIYYNLPNIVNYNVNNLPKIVNPQPYDVKNKMKKINNLKYNKLNLEINNKLCDYNYFNKKKKSKNFIKYNIKNIKNIQNKVNKNLLNKKIKNLENEIEKLKLNKLY